MRGEWDCPDLARMVEVIAENVKAKAPVGTFPPYTTRMNLPRGLRVPGLSLAAPTDSRAAIPEVDRAYRGLRAVGGSKLADHQVPRVLPNSSSHWARCNTYPATRSMLSLNHIPNYCVHHSPRSM